MKSTNNKIRKVLQTIIESQPGIARSDITKQLQERGHDITCNSLSATLRRMRCEGYIYLTGSPMNFLYWPGENEVQSIPTDDLAVKRTVRAAVPADFHFPIYATPMHWSMAHLLGA